MIPVYSFTCMYIFSEHQLEFCIIIITIYICAEVTKSCGDPKLPERASSGGVSPPSPTTSHGDKKGRPKSTSCQQTKSALCQQTKTKTVSGAVGTRTKKATGKTTGMLGI